MNSKPVEVLNVVELDVEAAIAHYATYRSDARSHFTGLLEETLGWIEWNPDMFPRKYGSIHRAILKRSYFVVYYVQEKDLTLVLAVLDARDKPKRILELIQGRQFRARKV